MALLGQHYPDVIMIKQESSTSLENKFITFQIELFYQDDKTLLKFQLDFSSKQLLELLPCLTNKESVSLHFFLGQLTIMRVHRSRHILEDAHILKTLQT
jgi:hypothetical protein